MIIEFKDFGDILTELIEFRSIIVKNICQFFWDGENHMTVGNIKDHILLLIRPIIRILLSTLMAKTTFTSEADEDGNRIFFAA